MVKQTAKFSFMEQWNIIKAYDYCYNVTDGTHDSPKQTEFGKYLITSKHIKDNRIDFESAYKISEDDYNKIITRSKVDQWDIIISMIGAYCGFCCIESSKQTDYAIKNVGLLKVGNELKCKWLYYYLTSPHGKQQLSKLRSGSSQPYISLGALRNLDIPVPNENTMSDIVSVLSSLDSKIELNRRINDNLEQQAQALFKAWFVEFEPFGGTMPSNWEICEAQKYFNINIGKTPPRNEMRWFSQKSTDCKWASISDLGKCGLFINDTSEYLTKDAVETFNIIVVPKGTILLSFKLTLGRVSITTCPLTTNEAIARFLINHDYEREYLYLLLKQFDYTSLGNTSSIATAVNSKIIRSMPIMMPTVDVLQRFHHIVSPIFTRMRFLSDEIMQLTDTRNTVLPQLMSGGLKINNLNC